VARASSNRLVNVGIRVGSRVPAYCVSTGRVLLAGLSDDELDGYLAGATLMRMTSATIVDPGRLREEIVKARSQGYAWVQGELDESICGLAVPIRDRNGTTIAGLNVSLASGEFSKKEAVDAFLGDLRMTASRLRASVQ
jgi:IclR family pca regulon transcriptional regulator